MRYMALACVSALALGMALHSAALGQAQARLRDMDPRLTEAEVAHLPRLGPRQETDFVVRQSLVDGWAGVQPDTNSEGWTFFSALGYDQGRIEEALSASLAGPIRFLAVRGERTDYVSRGQPGTIIRYLVPACLAGNAACGADGSEVDALLAFTSWDGRPGGAWMQFHNANGSRFCMLVEDGWHCKTPPGGWRDQRYRIRSTTHTTLIAQELEEGWARGGPGIRFSDVMGSPGGSSAAQPDPYEVRCMMREIAC